MTGREEHELSFKRQIENRIVRMPKYVHEWYNNLLASNVSIRTCATYLNFLEKYFKSVNECYIIIKPEDLTPDTLDKFFISLRNIDGKKASDSLAVTAWYALKKFFEFLKNRNYIKRNFVLDITKPKNRDEARINEHRILLDKDDFTKILEAANNDEHKHKRRDVLILALLMSTGMRKSALMEIDIENIDFKEHLLHVTDKGEKRHTYVLSPKIMGLLKDYFYERCEIDPKIVEKPLFINNRKQRISIGVINYTVKKYTEEALGKKLSPHKLRAGFCSILYSENHDIEFVRRAVGHSSSTVTQRYIVTDNSEKKKASEIMDSIF